MVQFFSVSKGIIVTWFKYGGLGPIHCEEIISYNKLIERLSPFNLWDSREGRSLEPLWLLEERNDGASSGLNGAQSPTPLMKYTVNKTKVSQTKSEVELVEEMFKSLK